MTTTTNQLTPTLIIQGTVREFQLRGYVAQIRRDDNGKHVVTSGRHGSRPEWFVHYFDARENATNRLRRAVEIDEHNAATSCDGLIFEV